MFNKLVHGNEWRNMEDKIHYKVYSIQHEVVEKVQKLYNQGHQNLKIWIMTLPGTSCVTWENHFSVQLFLIHEMVR